MDFEGIYCFDTASVRFAFYPDGDDGARILGLISEQTLRDVCGARDGSSESLLATCRSHFSLIRDKAIELYTSAADRGNEQAQIHLALLYYTGQAGFQDDQRESDHESDHGSPQRGEHGDDAVHDAVVEAAPDRGRRRVGIGGGDVVRITFRTHVVPFARLPLRSLTPGDIGLLTVRRPGKPFTVRKWRDVKY